LADGSFTVTNHQWGTSGNDIPTNINTDTIYNAIYVSGYTSGVFPGSTSTGSVDAFISTFRASNPEYSPNSLQWGTNETDQCVAVASSSTNVNVYCVGWTDGVFENAAQERILGGRELFASGVNKQLLPLPNPPTQSPETNIIGQSVGHTTPINILLAGVIAAILLTL